MALETMNYVGDFDLSNPVVGDPVAQGDDHMRGMKTALKQTFPNATKAFRFPTVAAVQTGTVTVTAPDDQNKVFPVNATAANRTVNLPDLTGAGVHEDGFSVTVVKIDSSTNTVTIDGSASQTINGATTLVLTNQWQVAKLVWSQSDAEWYAHVITYASETVAGMLEIATSAEVIALVDTVRAVTPAGLSALTPDDTRLGMVEKATVAEVRAATSNKGMTTDLIESAAAYVTLTDAATVALDWDAFINGLVTLTASRILGNPTNGQPGTVRTVRVIGDSATDRVLTFGNEYKGVVPVLTDIDDTKSYELVIKCITASHFCIAGSYECGV